MMMILTQQSPCLKVMADFYMITDKRTYKPKDQKRCIMKLPVSYISLVSKI